MNVWPLRKKKSKMQRFFEDAGKNAGRAGKIGLGLVGSLLGATAASAAVSSLRNKIKQ